MFRLGLLAISLGIAAWFVYLASQVRAMSSVDQIGLESDSNSADAIAVFGAAQYRGRPSPVFHLRLDHAVELYNRGIAGTVVTLGGGSERDSGRTEGGVGRDYLLAHGVPLSSIIAETQSTDTVQQVQRLAAIARDHQWRRIVIVSDGTHMFRLRALCQEAGLDVLLSPRAPVGHLSAWESTRRLLHEVMAYSLERLGLSFGEIDFSN